MNSTNALLEKWQYLSAHIGFPPPSSSSSVNPPMITAHPQNMFNVIPGTNAAFTVNATGLRLNYTWKLGNGSTLPSDDRFVPNDILLTIQNVQSSDVGSYCCEVSNAAGSVTSKSASLTLSELCIHGT